jgi:flagellar protein FliO/FliZ
MDLIEIGRYLGALLMVLALIGFAAVAARRYGLPGMMKPNATRRLAIVESLMLGPRQRVFLLRCDKAEHLVVIGPEGASLIAQNIPPQDAPPAPPPQSEMPA